MPRRSRANLIVELQTPEQDLVVITALRVISYTLRWLAGSPIALANLGRLGREGLLGCSLVTSN